jgi:hypothetical protein
VPGAFGKKGKTVFRFVKNAAQGPHFLCRQRARYKIGPDYQDGRYSGQDKERTEMTVGDPNTFAIESELTLVYDRLSQLALGFSPSTLWADAMG